MSYRDSLGRYVEELSVPLVASAARTANGNGSAVLLGQQRNLSVVLEVSAASGTTPTLAVTMQTSYDGSTWRTLATFGSKTGVSSERISAAAADKYVRATWLVGGTTPSFTFSVTATAV